MTTAKVNTQYEAIRDIPVTDFLNDGQQQTVKAQEIWKTQPAVVIVIRRPGCQFCREEARIFHAQRETIEEKMGMRMVCIVHEKEGSDIFQKDFWKGQVYFDESKGFYKALGGGRLRMGSWEQLIKPAFWSNFLRNKRSGVKGNFEGNGHILGGLYVVKAGDEGIAYEHVEKVWGDIAQADQVLEACSQLTGVALSPEDMAQAKGERAALEERMQKGRDVAATSTKPNACDAPTATNTAAPAAPAPAVAARAPTAEPSQAL
ncbi:hypothetical protein EMPS_03460 [Entomortierella parvispora]|uniref:Peroxiredoxin-like 2A n=1 Tax=Entomortierella parvispora TaxID=205924 RepID=A0A9P3LUW8_9FUNG|nr:hypothetical protein EMPS_03460 [Entomortierella parvispora]